MTRTRFPQTAATHAEARAYYLNRTLQLLQFGWSLKGEPVDLDWGVQATLMAPTEIGRASCRERVSDYV